jgi:transcriptional regulator with PAS, ATPase and Fis domain
LVSPVEECASCKKAADQTPAEMWRDMHAPNLIGREPKLLEVFGIMASVADADCSVLVTGETGTGKELIARALHAGSNRKNRPFVAVNCAAIPENLIESELFGYAKGSFTGAVQSRQGRFSQADGGTIFLDEIGELPLALQAKMLRVLQEQEVTPLGESKAQKVDVRVIAATNRDLEEMAETGKFREDLLYRLNVIPIELPPLRERRCDIPVLIERFLLRCNDRRSRSITGISHDALMALTSYAWPGNIRQLENTVERMVLLRSTGEIGLDDLPPKIREAKPATNGSMGDPQLPENGIDLRDAVEQFENALIRQALERTGWNKNRAATILQMNRTTLVEKLKKKGLAGDEAVRGVA